MTQQAENPLTGAGLIAYPAAIHRAFQPL